MRHSWAFLLCAAATGAAAQSASQAASQAASQSISQSIYKCTVDGKISYGQSPCSTGTSVALDLPAAAAAAPAPDQDATLARQKKEAARLEKQRHEREAMDGRQQEKAGRAAAAYRKKCARLALNKKWADEDAAGSGDSSSTSDSAKPGKSTRAGTSARDHSKAQLKAHRAAEKLALECPS